MNRLVLALSAIVAGVVVSGCALGIPRPATQITKTSATLNGEVLSTTGGPGSWYIEYGTSAARTQKTPTRTINLVAKESKPVSEPINGLTVGTTYHFAVCAEDSENPGFPACSSDQTFDTEYDPTLTLIRDCSGFPPNHGIRGHGDGFPPFVAVGGHLAFPDGSSVGGSIGTNENGSFSFSDPFLSQVAGTWTATIGWSGGTVVESLFVDCSQGGT